MKKILLNILTHGDETVGTQVAGIITERYQSLLGNGLDIEVANERAYQEGKRHISDDLNRVFPGKQDGSYEERRAYILAPMIGSYELVIDVHATESGAEDIVIVTKLDADTKKVLRHLAPRYVLFMNMKPDTSLISVARVGIAFEMGNNADERTSQKTIKGIESLLSYADLIPHKESLGFTPEYFEVTSSVPKPPGARLKSHVLNFQLIKRGEIFAEKSDGAPIVADRDFYPVIFGSTNYETIFGFAAQLLTKE